MEAELSKATLEKVVSAKAYIEQKFLRLREEEQRKREEWDSVQKQMAAMSLSSTDQELVKQEILRKEAEHLRKKRQRLSVHDFTSLAIIGKGAYGEVHLCRFNPTGEVVAMKKMRKSEMKYKNQVKHIKAERDILAKAKRSEWIVELKYSFQDESCLYLCMEYLPGGDLMTVLMQKEILSEAEARFYAAEIVMAIEVTHDLNYIHRDLKPDNILLDASGHIKLTDFGLCAFAEVVPFSVKLIRSQEDPSLPQPSLVSIPNVCYARQRKLALSTVGTPDYIAPEIFSKEGYNETVDWWSLGVILFEMMIGYPPFYSDDPTNTCHKIINWKQTLAIPPDSTISPEAADLILRLLKNPKDRLGRNGVQEIKDHPFFSGVDWLHLRSSLPPHVPELGGELDTRHFETFDEEESFIPEQSSNANRRDIEFIGYTYKQDGDEFNMISALNGLDKLKLTRSIFKSNNSPIGSGLP